MAGFNNVVCTKEFTVGPGCREKVYEDAEPRQKDCLDDALLQNIAEWYLCTGPARAGISSTPYYQTCGKADYEGEIAGPANFSPCPTGLSMDMAMKCYCTGLSGMVCTACLPDLPIDEPVDTDPDVIDENIVERRLPSITTANSDYNIPIPRVFGTVSVSGNICWLGDEFLTTQTTRESSGSTVEVTVTDVGTCDFMVGVCAGEIGAISRIWLSDVLVYNNTAGALPPTVSVHNQELYNVGFTIDIFDGSEAQKINRNMASQEGFGRVPAYRGLAYLLFNNYPMTFSNAKLPNVVVEVVNDVDTTVRIFSVTNIGVVTPEVFDVDGVSLNVATNDGSWIDLMTLEVSEIPTIADTTSIQVTDQGDYLLTPDDDEIKVVSGRLRDEMATYAIEHDGGHFASLTFNTRTAIVLARNDAISVLRWDVVTETIISQSEYTALTTGNFVNVLAANMSFGGNPAAAFRFIGIAQETGQLKFILGNYLDTPLAYTLVTAGTYLDAMVYPPTGSIIVWVEEDGDIVVRQLRFVADGVIQTLWTSIAPAYVPNKSKTRFFPGISRYDYITGDSIYTMNLLTGLVQVVGELLNAPTPSSPLAQYYDGRRGYIAYSTDDGELCKVYPTVIQATGANLQKVLEYMDETISAPTLGNVVFDGFLLMDQDSAADAVQDLATFFNLTVVNNGAEIKISSVANSTQVSVDAARETIGVISTRGQYINELTGIAITYMGEDGQDTQTVRRDVLAGYDDYVANIEDETYVLPIRTTPLIARQSAERLLLRRLQRQSNMELLIAPSLLELEPGDYIFDNVLVSSVELGNGYDSAIEGKVDDPDIYTVEPGLDGISPFAGIDVTVYDENSPLRVYPIVLKVAPSANEIPGDQVYIGLLNPDDADFETIGIYIRGNNTNYTFLGQTTAEVNLGRLVSPADYTLIPFHTDETSEIVVEFYKDVTDHVQNKTRDEINANGRTNLIFIGQELMQYRNAAVAMDGKTVTFSGLLRGQWGTVQFTNNHVAGELCALYDPATMLIGNVPLDSTSTSVLATNGGLSRNVDSANAYLYTRNWGPAGMLVRKITPGGDEDDGIWFRLPGTKPFITTFRAEAQYTDPIPPTAIVILKAPYDPDLFLEKFVEGGFSSYNDEEGVVNTNDYIARMIQYTSGNGYARYSYDDLTDDGFTLESDIYVAASTTTYLFSGAIIGPVDGYFIEGEATYDRFKSALKVIV